MRDRFNIGLTLEYYLCSVETTKSNSDMETVKFENREALEDSLIRQDFNSIEQEILNTGGSSFLRDILYSGWKGVSEMTDEELIREFNERTDKVAVIG